MLATPRIIWRGPAGPQSTEHRCVLVDDGEGGHDVRVEILGKDAMEGEQWTHAEDSDGWTPRTWALEAALIAGAIAREAAMQPSEDLANEVLQELRDLPARTADGRERDTFGGSFSYDTLRHAILVGQARVAVKTMQKGGRP